MNNTISTRVFTKLTKFPVHRIFEIRTNYKPNTITCELQWLFDKTKSIVMILSFAPRYENFNKRFISKLQTFFTNDKISVNFIWSTCNNKDNKMQHLSCVVYKVFALVVQIILEN